MAEKIYVVKSGESLSIIARDILGDLNRWKELAFINGLRHPYWIKPGQILQLPSDDGLVIEVIGKRPAKKEPIKAATVMKANFLTSPATVIAIVIAAAYLLTKK